MQANYFDGFTKHISSNWLVYLFEIQMEVKFIRNIHLCQNPLCPQFIEKDLF